MSDEKLVKYGLPAQDSERIVQRHFDVARERQVISRLHFDHAIQQGPALAEVLRRIKGD